MDDSLKNNLLKSFSGKMEKKEVIEYLFYEGRYKSSKKYVGDGIAYLSDKGLEEISNIKNLTKATHLEKIYLKRPGEEEQFPEFEGNFCEVDSGGDQLGENMSGMCSFRFVTGYFMTADFSCELEAPPE